MTRRTTLSLALAGSLLAGQAFALTLIDDFSVGTEDLSGASGSHLTADPGILGGERLTEFNLTAGSSWNPAVGIAPTATYLGQTGWMFYSSTYNNLATWSVTYGANQDLNADWTACGAQRLILGRVARSMWTPTATPTVSGAWTAPR
jgi:hypothetical protein